MGKRGENVRDFMCLIGARFAQGDALLSGDPDLATRTDRARYHGNIPCLSSVKRALYAWQVDTAMLASNEVHLSDGVTPRLDEPNNLTKRSLVEQSQVVQRFCRLLVFWTQDQFSNREGWRTQYFATIGSLWTREFASF
jgi:hypothetical protein